MSGPEIDWSAIRLVVFDVDGTLYDQRAMRSRMLRELVINIAETRSLVTPRVLRNYRRTREAVSKHEVRDFEEPLIAQSARLSGVGPDRVRTIVAEWIEHRPIAHMRACRFPHVSELFAALSRNEKRIGIFSDYPASEKLRGMDLSADYLVAAGDASVGILKPHPRGLRFLMDLAGIGPGETIMIGDRIEKDGEAARRAGVASLIRSDRPKSGCPTFSGFSDPVFAPLHGR